MCARLCLFISISLGFASSLAADVLYTVTDLGTLGTASDSVRAAGINNNGQVTGTDQIGSSSYAFLYSNGQMMNLGTLGSRVSGGSDINNSGQVTGYSYTSTGFLHAFLYSNGKMMDLGTLGGSTSAGGGINNHGQVTGVSTTSGGDSHAFLYSNGTMTDLGALAALGGCCAAGNGINDAEQVVGNENGPASPHAILYSNGQIIDLGTFGGSTSNAARINGKGQVTGYAEVASVHLAHAFLYSNGVMMDLGTLLSNGGSKGEDINSAGQIVGLTAVPSTSFSHAFLYSNGQMTDLNNLIDPVLGWTLSEATGINDSGQIVADGFSPGLLQHAFLLTPIPEPCTWTLLGVALFTLAVWFRRSHPGSG